jgi:CRISPR-associated protein Cas2
MVAYDVGDDRRRRRIHEILKDYGTRVQFSVFECRVDDAQLKLLRERLLAELECGDSVRWYPLCVWCRDAVAVQGDGRPPEDAEFFIP